MKQKISLQQNTETGWISKKLGDDSLSLLIMGQSPDSKTYNTNKEGLPFLQGKADFGVLHPNPKTWCNSPIKVARKNDLLISVRAPVGDMNIADQDYCIGRGLAAIRCEDQEVSKYLYYYLLTHKNTIEEAGTGSTFKSINKTFLEDFEVILPPESQINKVVEALDKVREAIKTQSNVIELSKELRKTTVRKLLNVGCKKETLKETAVGSIPLSWGVAKLSEIAKIERGKFSHRPRNDPQFYGGEIPFIQTSDVTSANGTIKKYSQTLNERGLSVSRIFPKGTIVITIAANIGFTGILDFDSAFPDSLVGISPKNDIINTDFLNYYLLTQQSIMDELASKGTQKNINIQFLSPWPVLLPPMDEQKIIVEILKTMDRKIEVESSKKELYEEMFATLLVALISKKAKIGNII